MQPTSTCQSLRSRFPGPWYLKLTHLPLRLFEFRRRRETFIDNLHKQYGPLVQIAPRTLSVSDAAGVREVFAVARRLDRDKPIPFLHNYASENIVSTVDGDLHHDRRKPLRTIYAHRMAESCEMQDVIVRATTNMKYFESQRAGFEPEESLGAEQQRGKEAALGESPAATPSKEALRLALYDIMTHVVYGPDHATDLLRDSSQRRKMQTDVDYQEWRITKDWGTAMSVLLPTLTVLLRKNRLAPSFMDGSFPSHLYTDAIGREALAKLESENSTIPKSRIVTGTRTNEPLIARLHNHYTTHGPSPVVPSHKYILSECVDHFWGGISTTLDVLTPLYGYLSKPENCYRISRLRDELSVAARGNNCSVNELSATQLKQLPFLDAVIRETLRTNPPIPFSLDRRISDREGSILVHGKQVPAGWVVGAQPSTVHNTEIAFPGAEGWIPERWLGADEKAQADKQTGSTKERKDMARGMKRHFVAFGSGPRMCLGMNVAWAIMRGVVAAWYGD